MKRIELDTIFTTKVNEYLANGYTFNTNTMGGSQGEIAHVDLRKGDDIIRILMESEYNYETGDTVHIIVGCCPKAIRPENEHATIWNNELEVIEETVFLKVSRDWFTSMEESKVIADLRLKRWSHRHSAKSRQIIPSAAFIRSLKNRKGFSNATKNNIAIEHDQYGYTIKLAARDGHISRTETIRFKK